MPRLLSIIVTIFLAYEYTRLFAILPISSQTDLRVLKATGAGYLINLLTNLFTVTVKVRTASLAAGYLFFMLLKGGPGYEVV